MHNGIDKNTMLSLCNRMLDSSGADVKLLGGRKYLPMTPQIKAEWDKVSDKLLATMMQKSFLSDANADARAELLRTGNSEFTHNFENGSSIENSTRFQDTLKDIRNKVRQNEQTKNNCT